MRRSSMDKPPLITHYNDKQSQYNYQEHVGAQMLFEKLIWNIDEVSRFTSYSKGTIYNLVSEGGIPYRKRRGRLWFIPSEVLKWLKGEL
jgi:excisionase family DNA binding protein